MSDPKIRDLQTLHAEMTRLLDAIEFQTSKAAPNMAELTSIRFQLTRASRHRAGLVMELIEGSIGHAAPAVKQQLESLRDDLQQARVTSAGHIGRWTMQAIESDWDGYKAASQQIRAKMRSQINRERTILQTII